MPCWQHDPGLQAPKKANLLHIHTRSGPQGQVGKLFISSLYIGPRFDFSITPPHKIITIFIPFCSDFLTTLSF